MLERKGFLSSFYDQLMGESDEIRNRFRFTDMKRQIKNLGDSLVICSLAVDGKPEGLERLNELAISHDKYHYNILPEWYPLWVDAILVAAAKHDPEWSEANDQAWRNELKYVIQRMISKYDPA